MRRLSQQVRTADRAVDLVLKSGLFVPPGPGCLGRPLSETAISQLCASLNKSPLTDTLITLTGLMRSGLYDFRRRGRPNTSSTATLTWEIAQGNIAPFRVSVLADAPGQYGRPDARTLAISITMVSRLTAWLRAGSAPEFPPPGTSSSAGGRRVDILARRADLNSH